MAFSLQHRCDLNSLTQGETDPLDINYGQGADSMLDAELLQVWFGQSGTMFRVSLSAFKILALIDGIFKMDGYTATMATRLDLASFFFYQLGCKVSKK